jgi:hypothetical protein
LVVSVASVACAVPLQLSGRRGHVLRPTGGWGSIEYGTPVPGQVRACVLCTCSLHVFSACVLCTCSLHVLFFFFMGFVWACR